MSLLTRLFKRTSPQNESGPIPSQWQFRLMPEILKCHLILEDKSSHPGAVFIVELRNQQTSLKVTVRVIMTADLKQELRSNIEYHAEAVARYISEILTKGWTPHDGAEQHTIFITNPPSGFRLTFAQPSA